MLVFHPVSKLPGESCQCLKLCIQNLLKLDKLYTLLPLSNDHLWDTNRTTDGNSLSAQGLITSALSQPNSVRMRYGGQRNVPGLPTRVIIYIMSSFFATRPIVQYRLGFKGNRMSP